MELIFVNRDKVLKRNLCIHCMHIENAKSARPLFGEPPGRLLGPG